MPVYSRPMSPPLIGPPNDGIIETEIDGDIALYHPAREAVTILNKTASDIWRLCDGTQTLDGMVDTLSAAYAASRSMVAVDVERTIELLRSEGCLPA